MESSKKQRNKKNQKERQEPKNSKASSSKESITVDPDIVKNQPIPKEFEPQPQRAPRRSRNEQSAPSNIRTDVLQISSTPTITEKKQETPEPVVDHSNLKKETEEIAKLKKFSKRKITSNWHRYSPPEKSQDPNEEDGSAPADFSDLLQVPVSRGGHLALKDEQDWSSGSAAALGGYFALDLKKLNESLACIPLYEQIQIPKEVFTAEEIKEFDDIARKNKNSYNPESEINNTLIQDAVSHQHKVAQEAAQRTVSILKEDSLAVVLDIGNQPKQSMDSGLFATLNKYEEDKTTIHRLNEEPQYVTSSSDGQKITDDDKTIKNDSDLTNLLLESIEKKSEGSRTTESKSYHSEKVKNGLSDKGNLLQSQVIAPSNKINKRNEVPPNNVKNLSLDDDEDDLDFLLSLSSAVPIHTVGHKPNPLTVKDASSLEEENISQKPAEGKSSELDDWLDSVLED